MLYAEMRAPDRTPGTGAPHRATFPKLAEKSRSDHGGGSIDSGGAGVCAMPQAAGFNIGLGADTSAGSVDESRPDAGRQVYLAVKVAGEWTLSLLLLVVTLPLLVLFAAMVKLTSPGPIFYLQTRLGRNGRTYRICKLRTMAHDCEAATGPVWAAQNDPRITPIGKILRSTHMDELPQLWNVLCGDMSLIGPRPERPEIASRIEREIPAYRDRLEIRPGVTGLAQMRLPADSDIEGVKLKLAHDLYYIRNISLLLDLRIAVCTAFYFTAAAADAICQMAVGSYGREVDSGLVDDGPGRETA